jgi:hypothetical protein
VQEISQRKYAGAWLRWTRELHEIPKDSRNPVRLAYDCSQCVSAFHIGLSTEQSLSIPRDHGKWIIYLVARARSEFRKSIQFCRLQSLTDEFT